MPLSVFLLYEALQDMNTLMDPEAFVNLYDVEKAFDSVEHPAIFRTFDHLEAPEQLQALIQDIYSNLTGNIKVNGTITQSFNIKRGTKRVILYYP